MESKKSKLVITIAILLPLVILLYSLTHPEVEASTYSTSYTPIVTSSGYSVITVLEGTEVKGKFTFEFDCPYNPDSYVDIKYIKLSFVYDLDLLNDPEAFWIIYPVSSPIQCNKQYTYEFSYTATRATGVSAFLYRNTYIKLFFCDKQTCEDYDYKEFNYAWDNSNRDTRPHIIVCWMPPAGDGPDCPMRPENR